MKAKVFMLAVLLFSLNSCNAQDKKEQENADKKAKPSQNAPKGDWKVNREYDENGNLISYDSTYVYSYSSMNGDTISDAEMNKMMQHFRRFYKSSGVNGQSGLFESFFNDSIPENDFLNQGFFSHHMNSKDFKEQVRKMDSIHQEFMQQNYPQFFYNGHHPIIPREEEPKKGNTR